MHSSFFFLDRTAEVLRSKIETVMKTYASDFQVKKCFFLFNFKTLFFQLLESRTPGEHGKFRAKTMRGTDCFNILKNQVAIRTLIGLVPELPVEVQRVVRKVVFGYWRIFREISRYRLRSNQTLVNIQELIDRWVVWIMGGPQEKTPKALVSTLKEGQDYLSIATGLYGHKFWAFVYGHLLQAHIVTYIELFSTLKIFFCELVEGTNQRLRRHQDSSSFGATQAQQLMRHSVRSELLPKHSGSSAAKFNCEFCHQGFVTNASLSSHERHTCSQKFSKDTKVPRGYKRKLSFESKVQPEDSETRGLLLTSSSASAACASLSQVSNVDSDPEYSDDEIDIPNEEAWNIAAKSISEVMSTQIYYDFTERAEPADSESGDIERSATSSDCSPLLG